MFITNFQNPASEHAQALINFHNHIFFFLLIIISVIIWLLKLTFLFRIKNKNIFNKDILNKKNLIIFSWINLYIIKPLYRIFELIFKPSVLLYDNVNVYKFRWPKIIWYWIYVICEYIYKRYIIFYSKYLICSITNHILNINWIKNIIYNIYNIIYIVYNIIFQERFIKHIYVYKNLYNISHILAKLHMYMFNNRQITSSFNFYKEYMNCKKNFINSADYLYSKNFIFGTKLFMDVQKFYNLNKKKIYFNQLELYFFSKYSFSKYIAYIEFCYYIFNIIERQKLYSNVTNNKYNFLNLNFFEKFVSVSKFKRETFKTDKIFSYSRSVFFNNWIEVVFEKEHITEDDSDLEFYNGVYFSNLCLKTFNFLKQHKESNKANNNMIEVESIFNKETKCVESKFLPLYDAEKVFRKKSFWNENLKLNICSFKFLINSYIYSKIWSSSYMNFSQNKYKKYNYTFYNKILDSSSTHYNHSRYCNSSLYGKFILADVDYSYYLFHSNFKHSLKLEWIWTFIPISILMVILYPSLLLLYNYDKPYITKPYLTIKAIGNQWYWSYEYTDNSIILDYNNDECTNKKLVSTNSIDPIKFDSYMLTEEDLELGQLRLLEVDRRLVLPVGVCIRIVTTSTDVLHSWAVPSLGVKIDSIPGRLNQFWLVINKPGVFYGQCSELCGVNHGFMPIAVEGVSLDQYYDYLYNYYTNN